MYLGSQNGGMKIQEEREECKEWGDGGGGGGGVSESEYIVVTFCIMVYLWS